MTYEVQATIPYFNGLPRDCATNVWHFEVIGAAPDATSQTALFAALQNFYFHVYGTGDSIASYADPASTRMKLYNLSDATPRTPLRDEIAPFSGTIETATKTPPEVAICLSLGSAGQVGTPVASQRGRLYLGCIPDVAVNAGSITSFPTIAQVYRASIVAAAADLLTELATIGWVWVIYSRKLGASFNVTKGYVDDAFDIQRRRGQDPVIRTVFPF